MTNQLNINKKTQEKIIPVLKKYKIKKAGVFGSYARGEAKKNSDIDIIIGFNSSLLTLVAMQRELKETLGIKVDLLTYKGLNPLLIKSFLKKRLNYYEKI